MKRIIYLIAVLMQVSSVFAQLEVKSFGPDQDEMDAQQHRKIDANNKVCPLVKVLITDPEAKFEGDIVGTPEYKNGTFWVYMTVDATWLNIITKHYIPLRYKFPERLPEGGNYVMKVIKPLSDVPTGQLNIRSNVKNAAVFIDGEKCSNVTPYVFKGEEGKHLVVLKAPGYMDAERQAEIVLGKMVVVIINLDVEGSLNINGVAYGSTNVGACSFEMGSERFYYESPTHDVSLRPFTIGKRPVPVALWNEIMGTKHERNNGPNGEVVNVTYDECQEFISLLNQGQNRHFRLPTEAEWEYVAKHQSELGIEEIGRTMEWCSDWFSRYKNGESNSPTGPKNGFVKVVRGGSLYGENQWYSEPTYRWHQNPETPSERISFRLVEDR